MVPIMVFAGVVLAAAIWLAPWLWAASVKRRLTSLERTISGLPTAAERERDLVARVTRLERAMAGQAAPPPAPATRNDGGAGLQARPAAGSEPAVVVTAAAVIVTVATAAPPAAPPAVHAAPLVAAPPASLRPTPPPAAAAADAPDEGWEMRAGTSWFPRLGALIFIVGIALLLKFAIGSTGPLGRVVTGYGLSVLMLAGGVLLARRERYVTFGYSLIAGGWAGIYFTTYATHAIDAAHLVDSDVVATISLLAVSAGMVAHSLYYRSQSVTGLAYVIAYSTLAIAPLSGFSLIASLPLAASMLYVAQRFGWSNVSVLGVVTTYGLFAFRRASGVDAGGDTSLVVAYLTVLAYWLSFEIADILGARQRAANAAAPAPLFLLNAAGFFGASLLQLPHGDPDQLSWYLLVSAAMYLSSAIVRAKLLRGAGAPAAGRFDSAHAATGLAAAFVAWAIEVRFDGDRRAIAWLFETEMLVVAGLALRDRFVREMGSVVAIGAGLHLMALMADGRGPSSDVVWTVHSWTSTAAIFAGIWYATQAWFHAKGIAPQRLEFGYGWAASAILVALMLRELGPAYQGLGCLLLSGVLTTVGVRWGLLWRAQSYATGLIGALSVLAYFGPVQNGAPVQNGVGGVFHRAAWTVLPLTTALGYAIAARLSRLLSHPALRAEIVPAVVIAGCFGTTSLGLFEWRVLPDVALAPALAATGAVLLGLGHWRRIAGLRWQGYALAAVAAVHASLRLVDAPPDGAIDIAGVTVVIALLYVARFLEGSRLVASVLPAESTARVVMGLAATTTLALFKWRLASVDLIGPLWAAAGFTIVGLGRWRRITDLRWQGYPLLLLGAIHAAGPIIAPGDATSAQITALLSVIGLLYLTSLVTRSSSADAAHPHTLGEAEDAIRVAMSVAATALATTLIFAEVRPSAISLALAGTGAGLFGAGFLAKERLMRLSGLVVLLGCIAKLAVYDLREMEAVAQILSYMSVGLVLLAISWVYTRYREQIRKYL